MSAVRKTIPAGRFKATCLALLDQVARTGKSLVVTKRGHPVAEVVPCRKLRPSRSLRGSVTYHGDIVEPTGETWEADL